MELRYLLIVLMTIFGVGSAWAATDDPFIHFANPAAMATARTSFINLVFGQNTLPTTLPTVTLNVTATCGAASPPCYTNQVGSNIASVDSYTSNMSSSQTSTSYLYHANSPNNGRVVIINMGHQVTCSWPAFASGYNTIPLVTALLNAGYSVFASNMPRSSPVTCGDTTDHNNMFTSFSNGAMQYFFEPINEAENYWDANHTFSRYDMVGLSGGGWTTTVWSGIDPRILVDVAVAGSMPGVMQQSGTGQCGNGGDAEQQRTAFYAIAGYLDLYLMAASAPGHRQLQILNIGDNCCFGPTQWACQGVYGMNWYQYLAYYWGNLISGAATAGITPYRYTLMQDSTSTQHQISSPYAVGLIVNALANGTGGRHR